MSFPPERGDAAAPLLLCLALCLAAAFALGRWGPAAADLLLSLARLFLLPLSLLSGDWARAAGELPAATDDLSFAWSVLGAACAPYVPPALALVLLLLRKGWNLSPADRFRRTLSLRDLLRENLRRFPCVAPALAWPGGILAEPLDSGPWRAGRQPLQLALEQGLLLVSTDEGPRRAEPGDIPGEGSFPKADFPGSCAGSRGLSLDREAARRFYAGQLSEPWRGVGALPPWCRKLAGAWALFAADEKDRARRLLDELSLSYRPPRKAEEARWSLTWPFRHRALPAEDWRLDAGLREEDREAVRRALDSDAVRAALRPHSLWRDCALLALYLAARKKGVLPTAEFLWLRPVDRRLFYLCNNAGRRTVWPEIAGLWAHFQAEAALGRLDPESRGLSLPRVTEAVTALETALREEGFLPPDPSPKDCPEF